MQISEEAIEIAKKDLESFSFRDLFTFEGLNMEDYNHYERTKKAQELFQSKEELEENIEEMDREDLEDLTKSLYGRWKEDYLAYEKLLDLLHKLSLGFKNYACFEDDGIANFPQKPKDKQEFEECLEFLVEMFRNRNDREKFTKAKRHLTEGEDESIRNWLRHGKSISSLSRITGRSKDTIKKIKDKEGV